MVWHIIEGAAGCAYAVEHRCVAIIVDALRASATAAMLFHAGARRLLVVQELAQAFAARATMPDMLLFGERGGLPPEGFDFGNSPRTVSVARGRDVILTTTTGAQRVVAAWGAPAIYMGSTVNATAVVQAAMRHCMDIVVIPAGLASDPAFDAQEDWVAATVIAQRAAVPIGLGAERFAHWQRRIAESGVARLFDEAPNAETLRQVGMGADVPYCARLNLSACVPLATLRDGWGVWMEDASAYLKPET